MRVRRKRETLQAETALVRRRPRRIVSSDCFDFMTRVPEPSNAAMPTEVDTVFRQAAREFNFAYEDMCITDQSQCPPVGAEEDVQEWVDGM